MSNDPKTNPEDIEDDDEFDGEEEEDFMDMDMAGLLQSLLLDEEGETNVTMALINLNKTVDRHMTMQNKILVKILSKLGAKEG